MNTYVIDIETDGLVSNRIHVMSVGYKDSEGKWQIKSTPDYDTMRKIMSDPNNTVVGHNFKVFDALELERVLDFKIKATIIDTLPLSWYVFTTRASGTFGLAAFGEDYGIKKPDIEDWENLSYEEYKHRCEEDVKINIDLWEHLKKELVEIYTSWDLAMPLVRYLMFKMDCVAQQHLLKCKVDVNQVNDNMSILMPILEKKEKILQEVMPKGKLLKSKPKVMYKKDKSISSHGQKWFDYLREHDLPIDTEEIRDLANPNSAAQLKDWLFSMNWKPTLFKEGANGPVPQVRDKQKNLCKSVLKLADKEPAIIELYGMTVISHRLGVLKSFLHSVDIRGYTIAGMSGFTNTLRLKHVKPIANLPKVTGKINKAIGGGMTREQAIENNLRDGQIIRECIVAPKGYELCGSDVSALEDQTKRHYMWDYDPEYVTEQMVDGYDPHLALAISAGALTEQESDEHKLYSKTGGEEGVDHSDVRNIYKEANYSCIYGVGWATLGGVTNLNQKDSKAVIKSYWDKNWSIKQLPKDITTKNVNGQEWLQNPVNKLWYSVRSEKDIFSTLNQGTGVFVFDMWLKFMMMEGITPILQYHDEKLSLSKKEDRGKVKRILQNSMSKVNKALQLNVEIKVDVQFGNTYADVH
tara:strand:- start:62248 stop:64158 length:1911 start_codon:yes stop_codon:yes gene_type:complete